jgi:hypothetical protein
MNRQVFQKGLDLGKFPAVGGRDKQIDHRNKGFRM